MQQQQQARLAARMQREMERMRSDPPLRACVWPADDHLLTRLEAQIQGPDNTVYAKGMFKLEIQIPERYPFEPPSIRFKTPIYHPNIDNGGRICLDLLNMPPKGSWKPSLNISILLTSIGLLLSEPNADDGLMGEITAEYKHDRSSFDLKAAQWTEKYAIQASVEMKPPESSIAAAPVEEAPFAKPARTLSVSKYPLVAKDDKVEIVSDSESDKDDKPSSSCKRSRLSLTQKSLALKRKSRD